MTAHAGDDVALFRMLRILADSHRQSGRIGGRWRAWVLRRAARIVKATVGS